MVAPAPSRVRFGEYDIERKLGRGMTDVYLAFDAQRGRHAVLKLIRHAADPGARQVIEAERRGASIQQQLHAFDGRVIQVYDYGDLDGCFFVAMEHVEGENVSQILRRARQLDPQRAARIALEIAGQLEALHSFQASIDGSPAAVVHGDIKPSNIQVGADGRVCLLDFGIAKSVTVAHALTLHEFGSPNYCSPERLVHSEVDTDADLWALGVTLYEMVAGSPPYQAESTRKLEHLIQSKRPPRALPRTCPRGLKAIIGKALAADPAQRYGTAANLREDLAAFLENRPTVAERERRRPWRVTPTVESSPDAPWWQIDLPWARVASAAGCLVLGMAVFLSTGYYWRYQHEKSRFLKSLDLTHAGPAEIAGRWNDFQHLRDEYNFLGRYSPVTALRTPLRAAYVAAADAVIDAYRQSADPAIEKFDWSKAQACLQRALAIGQDPSAKGKLALALGYLDWIQQSRDSALHHLEEAAAGMGVSADPHLALARLYAYGFRDTDSMVTELTKAEAFGYNLQPREIEQKADAYRFRAWKELGKAWTLQTPPAESVRQLVRAQSDLEAAQILYEQIKGFDRVDQHLSQVKAIYAKTLSAPLPNPVAKPKPRSRRWR